jgi:DNA-binding NarL/FixJ family response regulator
MVVALTGVLRDGGAAIRELRNLAPETALVLASTATTASHRAVAAAAGAAALVSLDGTGNGPDELVEAIHAAAEAHS